MPLYLVRWANLSAALVSARNEDHLLDILDEVGDPTGARWTVYRGALHIEIEPHIEYAFRDRSDEDMKPLTEDDLELGDLNDLREQEVNFSSPFSDTGSEMEISILSWAFPNIYRAVAKDASEKKLRRAVIADLKPYFQTSWEAAKAPDLDDPVERTAYFMGTSRRVAENLMKAKGRVPAAKPEGTVTHLAPASSRPRKPKK